MTPADSFRLIEHTADMGIEARAGSCERVMAAMARGLAVLMFGDSAAKSQIIEEINVCAGDPVELLVNWLNEIVYWCEQGNLVPASCQVESVRDNKLKATLSGSRFDPQRHVVERQVKAVTYHQACLEERPGGWYARVYVDL